jgi:hypothetical protein
LRGAFAVMLCILSFVSLDICLPKKEGKIIEQVIEFKYLGNKVSKYEKDMGYKLQTELLYIIYTSFGCKGLN